MEYKTNPRSTPAEHPDDQIDENEIYVGTENVFADLGLANPVERGQKATIANGIEDILEADGLTPAQAAEIMGISTDDVSNIVSGRIRSYPLKDLFRYFASLLYHNFTALDQSLEVILMSSEPSDEQARVSVKPCRRTLTV